MSYTEKLFLELRSWQLLLRTKTFGCLDLKYSDKYERIF